MKYEESVRISLKEFERINKLLSISSLEELTERQLKKLGATTNSYEGLFYIEFENSSTMTIDLCSGSHNYYDNVVWTSANKKHDVWLDCEYELSDIEVEIEGDLYIVKIIVE